MHRNCAGFTLLEALTTALIVLILGTIAISGFKSAIPTYRLKTAARELYSNMHRTKMMAIKNNTSFTIEYKSNPDRYHLSAINKTVVLGDYGGGIRFQGPQGQTFASDTITFNSRGTCNAGYAYITDGNNTSFYKVGPLSTGIIKLQRHISGDHWE